MRNLFSLFTVDMAPGVTRRDAVTTEADEIAATVTPKLSMTQDGTASDLFGIGILLSGYCVTIIARVKDACAGMTASGISTSRELVTLNNPARQIFSAHATFTRRSRA